MKSTVLIMLIRPQMHTVMFLVHLRDIVIGQLAKALDAPGQLLSLVGIAESFTRHNGI